MSRGNSGRIVIEVDPSIKDNLYIALAKRKLTLKDWFLLQCSQFLYETTSQPSLFGNIAAEPQHFYDKQDIL